MASDSEEQPLNAVEDVELSTTSPEADAPLPLRASRKREREPSIEPQTPKSENEDPSGSGTEHHDRRARAKKNRLDTVDELDSPPRSPPLSDKAGEYSPGQTAALLSPMTSRDKDGQHFAEGPKLQQIREKVKDLNWQEDAQSASLQLLKDAEPLPLPLQDEVMRDQTQSKHDISLLQDAHEITSSTDVVIEDLSEPRSGDQASEKESDDHFKEPLPVLAPSPSPDVSTGITAEGSSIPIDSDSSFTGTSSTIAFPASASHQSQTSDSETPSDIETTGNENGNSNNNSLSRKRKLTARETTFGSGGDYPKKPRESKPSMSVAEHLSGTVEEEGAEPSGRPSSPPPVNEKVNGSTPPVTASSPKPKQTGFAAFSATASPFASVKGPSVFGQTPVGPTSSPSTVPPKPKLATGFASFAATVSPFGAVAANSTAVFGLGLGGANAPSGTPLGRSESSPGLIMTTPPATTTSSTTTTHPSSPERSRSPSGSSRPSSSALNRRKSPPPARPPRPGQAFGAYNSPGTPSIGFSAAALKGSSTAGGARHSPSPSLDSLKRKGGADADDEEEGSGDSLLPSKRGAASWGEMLVSSSNGKATPEEEESPLSDKHKVKVEEVDVMTGEEDEETRHQVRAKLYYLDDRGTYKERGTGVLKINVRKTDGAGARLVMRADAVLRLILNVILFPGMGCSVGQDPKYVRISCIENSVTSHYAIRVASPKAAQDLLAKIQLFTDAAPTSTSEEAV